MEEEDVLIWRDLWNLADSYYEAVTKNSETTTVMCE